MACDHCERAGQPCECEGDCPECLSDLRESGLTAEQQAEELEKGIEENLWIIGGA